MTGDAMDSQITHFADFEQIKIDPTRLFLLTLSRQIVLLSLDKTLACQKQSQPSLFEKNSRIQTYA